MEGSFPPSTPGFDGGAAIPPPPPPDPGPGGFGGAGWTPPPPPAGPPPLPWEEPGRSPIEGLIATVKLFFGHPTEAFRRMSLTAEMLKPILYAIIVGWIGMAFAAVYESLFHLTLWNWLPGKFGERDAIVNVIGNVATIFFAPLLIMVGLVVGTAITHLMLILLGGARRGFGATFRVNSYGMTATLLGVVPLLGGLLNLITTIILQVIGLSQVHGISKGRAAAAVLVPGLLCCVLTGFAMVMFGAAMMAMFK